MIDDTFDDELASEVYQSHCAAAEAQMYSCESIRRTIDRYGHPRPTRIAVCTGTLDLDNQPRSAQIGRNLRDSALAQPH